MSWKGFLLRAGIDSDGKNVTVFRGNFEVEGTMTFTGGASIVGDATFADALILGNGRLATGVEAGSAISIDATAWAYSEGIELRYTVSDWADTYTLTDFRGMYLRAQSEEASSNSIYGAEIYGVTNAVNIANIWGALFYGYVKGAAAVTVSRVYGIQTEVTWDAGGSSDTISVEATPILAKVTSGTVGDYTKIHGMIIRLGDMNGGSRTYGSGIKIEDDADMSGTSVCTVGLNIALACTTGISLAGAMTDGIVISGACGDNGIEISGACTDSAIQIVTGVFGNGLFINADGTTAINISANFTGTTGILIAGTATNGISITGACTTGIKISSYTPDSDGSNGAALLRAGTYGSPLTESTNYQGGLVRYYLETSGGASYNKGLFMCLKTTGVKGIHGVCGLVEVLAQAGAGPTSVYAAQFVAHLNSDTAKIASGGGLPELVGVWAKITSNVGSTIAGSTRVCALWVDNQLNGTVSGEEYGIFATCGGSKVDAFIGFETTSSGWSNLFYFDETAYDQDPVVASGCNVSGAGASEAYLKVNLNGTAYGIPLIVI